MEKLSHKLNHWAAHNVSERQRAMWRVPRVSRRAARRMCPAAPAPPPLPEAGSGAARALPLPLPQFIGKYFDFHNRKTKLTQEMRAGTATVSPARCL